MQDRNELETRTFGVMMRRSAPVLTFMLTLMSVGTIWEVTP